MKEKIKTFVLYFIALLLFALVEIGVYQLYLFTMGHVTSESPMYVLLTDATVTEAIWRLTIAIGNLLLAAMIVVMNLFCGKHLPIGYLIGFAGVVFTAETMITSLCGLVIDFPEIVVAVIIAYIGFVLSRRQFIMNSTEKITASNLQEVEK